jgi:hypothetical protein
MAETLFCKRELVVDKPADHVWEWLSNIANIMTANQFHTAAEISDAEARNPRVGLDVPILHNISGRKFYRIARIMKFTDYEIAWGERLPEGVTVEDSFPHGEGWKVEPLGPNKCRIENQLRGQFKLPFGQIIGRQVWDAGIPIILDNDLQDVALASGAIQVRREIEMPRDTAAMLRLMHARQIDGIPVREYVNMETGVGEKPR